MYVRTTKSGWAIKSLGIAALIGIYLSSSPEALAKSWVETTHSSERVAADLVKDGTITLKSDQPFSEVNVANTKIADIVVLTDKSFHVMGKERGKTSVLVYDQQKRLMDVIDVTVNYDIQGLKKSLFEAFPNEEVEVRRLASKVYLSGDVSTAAIAEQAEKIAQAYAGESVTNGLSIRDSHQVMLEVRFIEASRSAIKELGLGILAQQAGEFTYLSGAGTVSGTSVGTAVLSELIGPTSIDVQIDALEEKGVIRTLAEPNLVSMSGESASFLAGGEFPIPVNGNDGEVTITYRQFGVGLAFTPTVLDDGIINLKVSPEVSQLDQNNAVRVGDVQVPALSVRRADTTVELRNSQSFAIAGLLQNTQSNNNVQVPWLGDIPILGSLFRSSSYRNNETELVIVVTPKLVQPVSDISQIRTPLDNVTTPSEINQFLNGKLEGPTTGSYSSSGPGFSAQPAKTEAQGGLSASYGHVIQ
ncbi:MAG: type II and III secretion system protein family protein [Acidimicrobiales bacterium]|nr:type II and III secretion system protein family protein [Hyphomonadaceae bacterium]RZV35422.1 MAG: type II and III secretion system protein family protein [Acidimicrobiales bacterium]